MMTNKDLIFASLMGSNNVQMYQRAQVVQNELATHVLPTIPFVPVKDNKNDVQKVGTPNFKFNEFSDSIPEAQQFFPLSFSFTSDGQKWLFPFEPMINVSSGNNIIKRNVAKQGENLIGTIKERWSRKDFEIQVTGVLMSSLLKGTADQCFPTKQMQDLFRFLINAKEIFVYSHPLDVLRISKVVVEDYSFPFTKGENVQAYDLKLVSDYSYNLLIKEDF